MEWIAGNSQVLNVFINLGMLLVWIFYAQLLLNSYRRARRPKVIIDQGVGRGMDSVCLVANMSNEAIFMQVVVASLYNEEDRVSRDITDLKVRERAKEAASDQSHVSPPQAQTLQGPLQPGAYLEIGTFWEILDNVLSKRRQLDDESREEEADQYSLELTIISSFGSENRPIGARRRFEFTRSDKGEHLVRATTVDTLRLTSLRERRKMDRWLRQYL